MMFGREKTFRRLIDSIRRSERQFFRQYVGDDVILIGGPGELFIYLDARDASLTPCLLRDRCWEPAISAWLARNLRAAGCFVDIGGNIGFHALTAAQHIGAEGLVVAFEPQQRLLDLCLRSICANGMLGHVHARRIAIGAEEGMGQLGKFAHLSGSATLTDNELIVAREEVILVPLPLALERFAREIGRPCRPDAIKIDVEGYEVEVWNGMKEWVRGQETIDILLEYSPVSYGDRGHDPLALLEDFKAHGLAVTLLQPDGSTRPLDQEEQAQMAQARRQFDLVLSKP